MLTTSVAKMINSKIFSTKPASPQNHKLEISGSIPQHVIAEGPQRLLRTMYAGSKNAGPALGSLRTPP